MTKKIILFSLLAYLSAYAYADDTLQPIPDLGADYFVDQKFRSMDFGMSEYDYKTETRYNKRLLRKVVKSYIEQTFAVLGFSETTQYLTTAAIGLAVQQGAKLNLGSDDNMYLQLEDLDENDRSIHYKFEYNW